MILGFHVSINSGNLSERMTSLNPAERVMISSFARILIIGSFQRGAVWCAFAIGLVVRLKLRALAFRRAVCFDKWLL